jgi:hypothetical protein
LKFEVPQARQNGKRKMNTVMSAAIIDSTERSVVKYLESNPPAQSGVIARETGISLRLTQAALSALVRRQVVFCTDGFPSTVSYSLMSDVAARRWARLQQGRNSNSHRSESVTESNTK